MTVHLQRICVISKTIQNNKNIKQQHIINPFPPSVPIWHRLAKLSILILEGIIKKFSYERRDYESVDEKSLSLAMSRKTTKKRIQEVKG